MFCGWFLLRGHSGHGTKSTHAELECPHERKGLMRLHPKESILGFGACCLESPVEERNKHVHRDNQEASASQLESLRVNKTNSQMNAFFIGLYLVGLRVLGQPLGLKSLK